MSKTSFEDHLAIVEASHSKTAASVSTSSASLLDKIAAELNLDEGSAAPAAPVAEGQVIPAASPVATPAAGVVGALDAVTVPQTQISGGDEAVAVAGESGMPVKQTPDVGVAVSAGDGEDVNMLGFNRTPEATAEAAESTKEARYVGAVMADAFTEALEKQSFDEEYSEAVEFLKESGLLDNYNIQAQPLVKEAAYLESGLEKIANNEELTATDMITAAHEYAEFEKDAEEAEDYGRSIAHEEFEKQAEDADEAGRIAAHEDFEKMAADADEAGRIAAHEDFEAMEKEAQLEGMQEEIDMNKMASLYAGDPDVANAVAILKGRGLI